MASLQQQIDQLSQRVRELETKRVLTAPVSNLDKTRDPVDGEHMVDHRDGSPMWFRGSDWRYGIPVASYTLEAIQDIPFDSNPITRQYQNLDLFYGSIFQSSENFYQDEDFPERVYVKTPGLYMHFLTLQMGVSEGFHANVLLAAEGTGRNPSDTSTIGYNQWFTSATTKMSAGDPFDDPSVDWVGTGTNPSICLITLGSFWDNDELALDEQYETDSPDDEEAEYPSYTRYFVPRVINLGPDDFQNTGGFYTVFRVGNRQLT